MSSEPFVSFAPNREDVVLFRALHDVPVGAFLDLGVRGPVDRSISHAFARRGWAGAVLAAGEPSDGLPAPAGDLHFVVVDAAPAERITLLGQVLPDTARPWVLVLRDGASGRPARPDPGELGAFGAQGYDLCLNDGVSLFLVDRVRSAELSEALSLPANVLDDVIYQRDLARDELLADLSRRSEQQVRDEQANLAAVLEWRRFAVDAWARAATAGRTAEVRNLRKQIELNFNHIKVVDNEIDRLRDELDAFRHTFSWRITQPLRRVRGITRRDPS
ncbi:MAG TPA: hypothetical protein VIC62_09110 [Nakamurella sp.]